MAFLPEQKQTIDELMRKHPEATAEVIREIIRTHPQAVKDAMKRVDVFHVVAKSTIGAVRHNKVNSVLKNHNVAAFTGDDNKSPTSSPSMFKRALAGTGRRASVPDNAPSKIVIPGMQREAPKISSLMANFGQSKNNKFDKLMNRWNDQNNDDKAEAEKKVAPPKKLVVSNKFKQGASDNSSPADSPVKQLPKSSPKARKGFVKMATLTLERKTSAEPTDSPSAKHAPTSPIRKRTSTRELLKAMSFGLLGKTDEEKAIDAAKKDAKEEEKLDEEFLKILPRAGSKTKVQEEEAVVPEEKEAVVVKEEQATTPPPPSPPAAQENATEQQKSCDSSPATQRASQELVASAVAKAVSENTSSPANEQSAAAPETVAAEEEPQNVVKEEPAATTTPTETTKPEAAVPTTDGKKKRRERRERKAGGLASKWAKKAEDDAAA